MKILFITPYSKEGASNRYRVEQYLPYLKREGFDYMVRPFVCPRFYSIIYKRGFFFRKIYYFLKGVLKRIWDLITVHRYDIVFIHREACFFGPPVFEWLIYMLKKPIIFDFDDAIFLHNYNSANRIYRFFKYPSKTRHIIKMSSSVIVANEFLGDYARKFSNKVYVIPTVIDTDKFIPSKKSGFHLVIGWIGSDTTSYYLNIIYSPLQELSRKYDFVLRIIGADRDVSIPGVKVENLEWKLDEELFNFQGIDIGIYPLPDTLWTRGKAAFKAIQYMAVAVPVVASPVGMNKNVIQDGINGYLAGTGEEWVEKLSKLIDNDDLKRKIGFAGRETVEEKYSIKVNVPKLFNVIKNIKINK